MQCAVCGFENMPGQTTCTRCRAQLALRAGEAGAGLEPPRAGRLKFLRPVGYVVNRAVDGAVRPAFARVARLLPEGVALPGRSVGLMALSLVPGLGHLVDRRPPAAAVAFGAWALALLLTASFYYGTTGGLLLGAVVGWHAGVVFDAGRVHRHVAGVGFRVAVMCVILLVVGGGYLAVMRAVDRRVEFARCPYGVKALGVEQDDVLFFRRGATDVVPGEIVLAARQSAYLQIGPAARLSFQSESATVAVVLALAGDEVEASAAAIRVNGRDVPPAQLPEGNIPLPRTPLRLRIAEGQLVAVTPATSVPEARGLDVARFVWEQVYVTSVSGVRGRAMGVYLPMARRRFFRRAAAR